MTHTLLVDLNPLIVCNIYILIYIRTHTFVINDKKYLNLVILDILIKILNLKIYVELSQILLQSNHYIKRYFFMSNICLIFYKSDYVKLLMINY